MADVQPPGTPSGWAGLLYFAVVTLITLGADYLRRLMPPPRRRKGNPDDVAEDGDEKVDDEEG